MEYSFASFGVMALIANLCASLMLVFVPALGLKKNREDWMRASKYYVIMQWCLGALAFVCLDFAFLGDDFRLRYVQMNSSHLLPWFYKLCALWGGHEGSMLLWICILQTWTLAAAYYSQTLSLQMRTRVLVVLGGLSVGFLLFILTTSNPFLIQEAIGALQGRDLNPLLQDPGFLFHPPMLYVGYVGFSIAFAVALSMLWSGDFDALALRWCRPWILGAWCTLTLGIVLGSWWAYRELGWGGFWFWDPVENASFMPWLAATALIHAIIVAASKRGLVAWVLFLSIIVFALSLVGTFLVRSGVLNSVHAFAVDPARGLYILAMLGVYIGGSLVLFALRAHKLVSNHPVFLVSREMMMLLNNVFLFVAMLTVLLGTLYPLIIDGLGLGKLSVGAPYFNSVFVPLMLPLIFLTGAGVYFTWGKDTITRAFKPLYFAASLMLAACLAMLIYQPQAWSLAVSVALCVWVIVASIGYLFIKAKRVGWSKLSLATYGMIFAHAGIGVCALGIGVSTGLGAQQDEVMEVGQRASIAGFEVRFVSESDLKGPNYHGVKGVFEVSKAKQTKLIYPEKRIYEVGNVPMTDAAVDVNWWRDVYVALGEPVGERAWGVRLYYKPLVRWIWAGGVMMFVGGLFSMITRARRL